MMIRAGAALSAVAVLLAGCGGGSSAKNGAPATTGNAPVTTTTTASATTTSTAKVASAADARLARQVTLTAADLGPQWQQYKAAQGVISAAGGCSYSPSGPLAKVGTGGLYAGPQVKFKGNTSYAYSTTAVFPDEGTAKAWAATRVMTAYKECRRKGFAAGAHRTDPTGRVITSAVKDSNVGKVTPGGQYADFTRYETQYRAANGKYFTNGSYDLYLYRHGRVLVTFELDRATAPAGDSQAQTVNQAVTAAIPKVLARAT